MKVLWFTNIPTYDTSHLNVYLKETGGWLVTLDKAIQTEIDLSVVFYGEKTEEFKYLNTIYYSIAKNLSFLQKIRNKITHHVDDNEDLVKYLSIINKVKPDIIHIHGSENSFGCIITHTKVPVVISIQGNITVYHHKYLSGFSKDYLSVSKNNLKTPCSLLFPDNFKKNYLLFNRLKEIEKKNLKDCKYVIGRTNWDKRVTRVLAPQSKYYHVDEILRDEFYALKWQQPNDECLKLFTTNSNSFYKGIETVIEASKILNNLNIHFKWSIAGISEDDLIVRVLKKKFKQKNNFKNIELLGRLGSLEIAEKLSKSNIYIMPSHIENSPNNLCEAMLLGIPCIATFAGGTSSLISDGESGLLIQDGDPWVLAGAVIELINDNDRAVKLGNNAFTVAHKRHYKENIVNSLLEVYSNILQSSLI